MQDNNQTNEIKNIEKNKKMNAKQSVKRIQTVSWIFNGITGLFSSISFVILIILFVYIFKNGFSSLSFNTIVSDYNSSAYFGTVTRDENSRIFDLPDEEDGVLFSKYWGVGLSYGTDLNGDEVIIFKYVDNESPFKEMVNHNNNDEPSSLDTGMVFKRITVVERDSGRTRVYNSKTDLKTIVTALDNTDNVKEIYFQSLGGGIRGSIVTTLYLILLTLVIVIPFGVLAAIYLAEYAPRNKFTNVVRTMIDMISGIPSVIFGLVSMIVFVPFVSSITGKTGGSIMAGALTLSVMLLPVVIRTTEEAINTIPKTYRDASLALGASKTETTFKVILPNALPGILTSVLLCIGRIIGESAALIFAIGTIIQDKISITSSSTTLAVHIWTVMSGDKPNYSQACAISIVILIIVLLLNILVKLIGKRLNRFEVK